MTKPPAKSAAKKASKSAAKSGAAIVVLPPVGLSVQVRTPFFKNVTAGLVIGLYDVDTNDVIVQAFPPGRESIQIPAIPFFSEEPKSEVKSAVWPVPK